MQTKRLLLVATCSIGLLLSACASKPDRRGPPNGERGNAGATYTGMAAKPIGLLFVSMDSNEDTFLDGGELERGIEREWLRLTPSSNATALDFENWSLAALGARDTLPSFIAFDRDLDGSISQEDFSKRVRIEFDLADADNNGVLSRSELLFRVSRPSRDRTSSPEGERPRGDGRGRPR